MRLVINAIPIRAGGGLSVLLGQLEGWRQAGSNLHVTVLASSRDTLSALKANGFADRIEPVLVGAANARTFFYQHVLLGRALRRFRPDVLMTNNHYLHNIPYPQVVHHQNLWRFVRPLGDEEHRGQPMAEVLRDRLARKALRLADANVFVSTFLRSQAERAVPESAPRNYTAMNAISDKLIAGLDEAKGVYDGSPQLTAIQSANLHKDNGTLLRTMAELVRRAPKVDWRMYLAGGPGRGSWAPYKEMAEELGIADRIDWKGFCSQEQLGGLLRRSLCLVFTSVLEAGPLPIMEAMGHYCPPIASNVTAMPEFVGDAGILVTPRAPVEFAEAIMLLYSNPNLRAQLTERGAERVRRHGWGDCAPRFCDIFERACENAALSH